jgi:hypothetical protein
MKSKYDVALTLSHLRLHHKHENGWLFTDKEAVPLHATEVLHGKRRYSSYSFSTLALDWGEWSSCPSRALAPGKGPPGTHCTGGWVGPRASLDTEARRKILCLCQGLNLKRPVVQPVARHYTD